MLDRLLKRGNFRLKSIYPSINANIGSVGIRGDMESNANFVALPPLHLGMKTLPFERDMQIQKRSEFAWLGKFQSRANIGKLAHNAVDGGATVFQIYKGSEKAS